MNYPFCYYYLLLLNVDLHSGGGSKISESVKLYVAFKEHYAVKVETVFSNLWLKDNNGIQECNCGILQMFWWQILIATFSLVALRGIHQSSTEKRLQLVKMLQCI